MRGEYSSAKMSIEQLEAIPLVLGAAFTLTQPQADLLDQIRQRLTDDEQQVWETILGYLPPTAPG